jgi:hypothetical protein
MALVSALLDVRSHFNEYAAGFDCRTSDRARTALARSATWGGKTMRNVPAVLAAGVVLCAWGTTQAAPITYSFSGTIDRQFYGPTPFSGTFFYDPDIPASTLHYLSTSGGQTVANYQEQASLGVTPGTNLGMTLNIGGQTYNTKNDTQGDEMVIAFDGHSSSFSEDFRLFTKPGGPSVSFGVGLSTASSQLLSSIIPPPNLDGFAVGSFNIVVDGWGEFADLSTWQLVPSAEVPEPASVLVYAAGCLAVGAGWRVRRRR